MKRIVWTREQDDILWLAWPTEEPTWSIAKRLDRSVIACYSRAKVLGIGRKYIPPKPTQAAPELGTPQPPKYVPTQDDAYVAACLAEGGFVYAKVVDGVTIHVRPCAQTCEQACEKPVNGRHAAVTAQNHVRYFSS